MKHDEVIVDEYINDDFIISRDFDRSREFAEAVWVGDDCEHCTGFDVCDSYICEDGEGDAEDYIEYEEDIAA